MSAKVKIVLRTDKLPKGDLYPLMVRITLNRKIQYISLRKYCTKEQWDANSETVSKRHKQHNAINLMINSVLSEVAFFLVAEGKTKNIITFESIKKIIGKVIGQENQVSPKSLFQVFDLHIDYLKKNNRLGYAEAFKSTLNSLKTFTNNVDISFTVIHSQFLREYEDFLNLRQCKTTTCSLYFRTLRTLWRVAMRDGFCPKEHYPFHDFNFSKYNNPKTKKRAISPYQIQLIEDFPLNPAKDTLVNSRNYFLFSFYCRGINFTDLAELKWTNIIDEQLNYVRAKTNDEFNFKLHKKAINILDYYKKLKGNSDAGYIFPILYKRHSTQQSIRERKKKILKRVNSDINIIAKEVGIEKRITTYVARHSFATALLGKGLSKEDISKTLQHEDLKTTSIYLDEIDNPYFDDVINNLI
jgi:site-specific recombinase XerD